MTRLWRWAGVAVLVTGLGCGRGGPPKVAARVDGKTISGARTEQLSQRLAKGDAVKGEVASGDLDKRNVSQFVLAYLIKMTYLENVARKLGVDSSDNPKEAKAVDSLPAEAFSTRGWEAGDLKEALRASRLSKTVAAKLFPNPAVDDDEIKQYYDSKADTFRNYWHAEVNVAFFRSQQPAKDLKARLTQGAGFAAAARDLHAEQQGTIAEVTPDAPLGAAVLDAITPLRAGQVSDPVAAGGGWFVLGVTRRVDTPAPTFDVVKGDLRQVLADQRRQELFYKWLDQQLAKANVEVSRRYGRWQPATLEVS